MENIKYFEVSCKQLPSDDQGRLPVDLYVYLPLNNKYVRFVRAGMHSENEVRPRIAARQIDRLFSTQPIPHYDHEAVAQGRAPYQEPRNNPTSGSHDTTEDFTIPLRDQPGALESSSQDSYKVIKDITQKIGVGQSFWIEGVSASQEKLEILARGFQIHSNEANPEMTSALDQLADQVLDVFNPEMRSLKGRLIKVLNQSDVMTDASAMTALAILIGMSNGFDSKKPIRDLIYATLIMDLPLREIPMEQLKQYYLDPDSMSPELTELIHAHPQKAFQIAQTQVTSATETTLQLILCHHELYNGKGYPRKIRTESAVPLVKVIAFAVDVVELMIRSKLQQRTMTFLEAFGLFLNEPVESHLRRHSKRLVQNTIDAAAGELN